MADGRIQSILLEPSGMRVTGKMFIDATYEGDLLAAAGVTYPSVARAATSTASQLATASRRRRMKNHRFVRPVDPYVKPGDPTSGLVAGVHDGDPPGEDGAADHRVQAYCFRMCMSNVPENSTPFPKPADYDEAMYELLLRNFEAGDLRIPMHPLMMPNGKTDTNNNHAFSTDNIGMNYDYPEASYDERAKIVADHARYQQGLMWTLANHPRVPQKVRDHMAAVGPREGRVHRQRQLADRDLRPRSPSHGRRLRDDPSTTAAASAWRRTRSGWAPTTWTRTTSSATSTPPGHVAKRGRRAGIDPRRPYAISYRSIVPQRGEAANLLVPVCGRARRTSPTARSAWNRSS